MEFKNKTVLITGASTGIGASFVRKLASQNCKLVLVARRIELLEGIKNELKLSDENCLIIKCDVSRKEEVARGFKLIKDFFGGIDIAILNAGRGINVTVDDYKSDYAEEVFGTNLFGMIYWIEQIIPDFLKKKEGVIVGISSLADNRGYSGSGFYCASKAAVTIYLEGLRIELKNYNIKVITVRPGFVKTPMTDINKFKMPFLMSDDNAAEKILEGIKREKKIIQFPWQMVLLTKLVGLIPNSIFEYIHSRHKV